MQPAMFFGPGQQPSFMPQNATAGRGGIPFAPQPGMMLPGVQPGRQSQFPGIQAQPAGRGIPNGAQQVPPNAFGMAGQALPFGPIPQGGPAVFPNNMANNMAFNQAMAQVSQFGRGGPGGRGQLQGMQGMQGMQGIPPQMLGAPVMRGRDARPPYPAQPGRGGVGMGLQTGQVGGFPQQGRAQMASSIGQPSSTQSSGANGPMNLPNLEALTSAPPLQQKQLLGEALYPKISILQPKLAGKITGMLLEMDNSELYSL